MTDLPPYWVRWPYVWVRRDLDVEKGTPRSFVYQLEYDVEATPSGQSTPE